MNDGNAILSKTPAAPLFVELHARHAGGLVRYLTNKFGDPDEARDIAQDAWLRITRLREPSALENPRAFLFQVATNLGIDRLRRVQLARRRGVEELETESFAPSVEEIVSQRQSLEVIERALNELPEKCRRAFTLHRFDGLSYSEIAVTLGISESMVEKHIIQALKALRASLKAADAARGTS